MNTQFRKVLTSAALVEATRATLVCPISRKDEPNATASAKGMKLGATRTHVDGALDDDLPARRIPRNHDADEKLGRGHAEREIESGEEEARHDLEAECLPHALLLPAPRCCER